MLLDCGCSLTSPKSKSLVEALTTNKHLEELNISDNPLADDIQHIAHALKVNQDLKKLDMSICGITSLSAKTLAQVLKTIMNI